MRSLLIRDAAGDAMVAILLPFSPGQISPALRLPSRAGAGHCGAMRRKARQQSKPENRPRFWGRHAVAAALANPERRIVRVWATREAAADFEFERDTPVTFADVADLGRLVPREAPHQGIVAEVERLEDILLAELLDQAEDGRPLLVLDQVTDPHNVGAILRSAAAFDALGIVTQDRHAPPESGALAKAASGALETVPWVRVVNLARALDDIAAAGFWRIGLTGEAQDLLSAALGPKRVALVLGAEGEGMRHNVAGHCDALARLPIGERMESLNVSNAAAIALYAARQAAA
jgi:23S rRNA (guanosine2251-2'-O)-methyltransferase